MSALTDKVWALMYALSRATLRSTIRMMAIDGGPRYEPTMAPGDLKVRLTTGGDALLHYDHMFTMHRVSTLSSEAGFLEATEATWPHELQGRTMHQFGNGLTLCDIALYVQSESYAIGLLQAGQFYGWWQLRYDEVLVCPHDSAACPAHCTVMIDQYSVPPRKPPKKKRKVVASVRSKFSLSELLPERGVAIA